MAFWKHVTPWLGGTAWSKTGKKLIGKAKEKISGGIGGGGGFGNIQKQLQKMVGGKKNFRQFMMGTDPRLKRVETLSHGQRKAQEFMLKRGLPNLPSARNNPMYQAGGSYLQKLLGQQPQERYSQLEAPYMRQFQEEIMPNLAAQYGGVGALSSSGFQNAAASAGQSLMERLASLNLGQQNLFRGQQLSALPMAQSYSQQPYNEQIGARQLQLQRMSQGLGTPSFGYQNIPGQAGMMQGVGQGFGQMIGAGATGMPGGGFGGGGYGGSPISDLTQGIKAGGNIFGGYGMPGKGGGMGGDIGGVVGGIAGAPFGPIGSIFGSMAGKTIGGMF